MTQPAQPASNDKTTLWGVLGIIGAFCCLPAGVVFSVLCMNEAKKAGKPLTLAYIGFGLQALVLVINLIMVVSGNALWAMNS